MSDIVERFKDISRRDDCFNHMVPSDVRLMLSEIDRLRVENVRLRRALTFYQRHWNDTPHGILYPDKELMDDGGKVARAALAAREENDG